MVNILYIFIVASVIYNLFNIFTFLSKGELTGIVLYICSLFNINNLIKFFVLNVPVSSVHLWFLLALIYAYIIQYLVTKFNVSDKIVFSLSFIGVAVHLFLGEGLNAFGIVVPDFLIRNFLLMGYPFFGIGMLIKKHEKKFKHIPTPIIMGGIVIGILLTLLSRSLFGANELYIGSIFIALSCVAIAIKFSNAKYSRWMVRLTSCSTNIYIFHILIGSVLAKILKVLKFESRTPVFMIYPILVCVLTTIFALIVEECEKKVKVALKKHS